jgi:hypothetical protein
MMKGGKKGRTNKRTIWLMESLAQHGYDYQKMLTEFLLKAAKGDKVALDMCHILVKLVPYLANMPKQDQAITSIDTLVINRYVNAGPTIPSIAGTIEGEVIADSVSTIIPSIEAHSTSQNKQH